MFKLNVFALALLSFVSAAHAAAPPELSLSDGSGSTVTIDSTGAVTCVGSCSTNFVAASAGSVTWSGTVGAFTVNIISGQTKPTLPPPQINLGFLVTTGATGGTLTVKWTDTGFDGLGPATMTASNTLNGSISATYTGYVDNTNTPFGMGTAVGTIGPFTSTNSGTLTGPGPTAEPFSMTDVVTAVMGPSSLFSLAGFGLTGTPPPPLSLACASASGQAGAPYDSFLVATGGFPPYAFSISSGSLPNGLTLNPTTGEISGTPSTPGMFSFTSQVVDSSGNPAQNTVQSSCGITITSPPVPLGLNCAASTGIVGVAYSSSLVATGGVMPYTFTIISGSLPTGLSLNPSSGAITGVPTTAGPFPFTAQVMDSSGGVSNTVTASCGITISGPPTATCVVINAVQGVAITPVTLTGSGGAGGPYTFTATGLPAGLTMSASGTISGTPTVSGTFSYTVTVKDSAGNTGTVNCSVTVNAPPTASCVSITAVQGFPIMPVTLSGSGGVGGPYTFTATGLPPGLSISSSGTISGTPTTSGTFPYTVTVTDSAGNTGTFNCSVTVNGPPTATCVSITAVQGFPIAPVTLSGSGGVGGPYTFTATGLPPGLSISSGGTISGTPTSSGTFSYTVTVTDSAGNTGTLNCSVTVNGPPTATCVSITAVQGFPITPVTLSGSGGVGGPYTFSAMGLPPGLSISSGGTISGTPTTSGTFPYTVTVTDSAGNKGTLNCSVTVNGPPTASCVSITAVQGFPITSVTLTGSGGVGGPYTFTATGLPPGLSISSGGTISGTPTSSGTFPYTVTITDSAGNKGTLNCSVTVNGPPTATCVSITAVQGFPITAVTLSGSGGAGGPYTFTATGLPAGLTMSTSGTISGTPTVSGTFSYTVTVKDSAGNTGTVNCSVTVNAPPTASCVVINAVQGVAITPVTLSGSGGAGGPYTFTATGLPAGLTMSTSGTISGTPTVSGTFSYTVTVKDSAGNTGTVNCSVTVNAPPTASCVVINAVQGVAITPVTLSGSGGAGGPYTFTATGLPAGLTMSTSGTISGTPTVSGTFSYTVTVKDSAGNTGTVNCSVTVNAPPTASCVVINAVQGVAITPVTLSGSGGAGGPYTFTATGLPAGLTMSASGTISGTPTSSGTFPYTVTITDKAGDKGTVMCSVTVAPPTVPQLTVVKTADSATITAGSVAGFTVTISNPGTGAATGVTLNDPLPPGAGGDVDWKIDTTTGNPADFTITGVVGSQVLALSPSGITINAGASLKVHITGTTSAKDATGSSNPALNVGGASGYTVLYEGTGGHNLQITNVTVVGNVGVGGTGHVQYNGPGTIGGRLDFSAANTGQYSNSNSSNVGPTSVNYNVSWVTTALSAINSLSTSLGGLSGTNISFNNSNQTVNESSGAVRTSGGITYRVFNVTSYSENNGDIVTIKGDGSGDPVVLNFSFNSNVNLGGDVVLTGGLTADQVIWNFPSSNQNINLNNNNSSYPYPTYAFQGVILAPNDNLSLVNASLVGRVWGGDSSDMQIVSGDQVHTPPGTGTLPNTATVSATNVSSVMATATITISPTTGAPVGADEFATIGFWHNKNGQALIDSLNGGSTSTGLANWLATNFPNLFGATSANNLTGQTNADVAALYLTFFGVSGQKTEAQIMAGALAVYATSTTLAGGNFAAGYAFLTSSGGSGGFTYNTGSDGTAIGLANNTSYTVLQLLQAANAVGGGLGNSNAFNALNDIFNGINSTGDIS